MTNQSPESVIAEALNKWQEVSGSDINLGVADYLVAALRAANMLREPGVPDWEYVGMAFEHGGFMRIRNDQLVPEKFESWRKLMSQYPRVEILKRVKAVPAGLWLPVDGEPNDGATQDRIAEIACTVLGHRQGGDECMADYAIADAILAEFPVLSRATVPDAATETIEAQLANAKAGWDSALRIVNQGHEIVKQTGAERDAALAAVERVRARLGDILPDQSGSGVIAVADILAALDGAPESEEKPSSIVDVAALARVVRSALPYDVEVSPVRKSKTERHFRTVADGDLHVERITKAVAEHLTGVVK